MRVYALSIIAAGVLASLSGCGGGGDEWAPQQFQTQIVSDPAYDGDIEQTAPGVYVVTQGMSANVQSTFAGIDPRNAPAFIAAQVLGSLAAVAVAAAIWPDVSGDPPLRARRQPPGQPPA